MIIPLTLDTEGTSDDSQLSALAIAGGLEEWNELSEQNYDYFQMAIRDTLGSMNHEDILIDELNAWDGNGVRPHYLNNWDFSMAVYHRDHETPTLKLGASFALWKEQNGLWTTLVREWTEWVEEKAADWLGDYSEMPEAYAKELQESYDLTEKYAFDEYVKGDRSNQGVLGIAAENIFGRYINATFSWEKFPADIITLEMDEEAIRTYLEDGSGNHSVALENWLSKNIPGYEEDGTLPDESLLPPAELLGTSISEDLNAAKDKTIAKKEQEAKIRKESYEKAQIIREAKLEKEEEARRLKLEAMKR